MHRTADNHKRNPPTGPPPPPAQTKVTIMGKNFWVPDPLPPLLSSDVSLPPLPSRVGWAWTGGLHHRVSLQRIPLPGKVRSRWGSGTTAITSATHLLRWV